MDRFERVVRLHRVLAAARYPVSKEKLMEELDCSRATLYRIVAFLRDHLGAPLETNEDQGGFYYDRELDGVYELPGMWLNTHELVALLTAYQVLAGRDQGLLAEAMQPLKHRIVRLLDSAHGGEGSLLGKVHLARQGNRTVNERIFGIVAQAVMAGQQIEMEYHGRIKDQSSTRIVSPQRLTFYRENWYLDAWCHQANDLRSFSLERVIKCHALELPVKAITSEQLAETLDESYGIFSGQAHQQAVIEFSEGAARWVADEQWHPDQTGAWLPNGRYQLTLPINNLTELTMDILRHGDNVKVIHPPELKSKVVQQLKRSLLQYNG